MSYLSYREVRRDLGRLFFAGFRPLLISNYSSQYEGTFSECQLKVIREQIESNILLIAYMGLNEDLGMSGLEQLKLVDDLRQLLQPIHERRLRLVGEGKAECYFRAFCELQTAMDVNIDAGLDDPGVNAIMQLANAGPKVDMTDVRDDLEKRRIFLGYVKDMTRRLLDRYTLDALELFQKYRPGVYAAYQQNQQLESEQKQSAEHAEELVETTGASADSKVRFYTPASTSTATAAPGFESA